MIQDDIKAALDGASLPSGARNYWGKAPQTPTTPYTVSSRVSNTPENTLSTRVAAIDNARVQVDSYAKTYEGAQVLSQQVRAAMTGATAFKAICILEQDLVEPDVQLHRVSQDFSIWV